VFAALVPLAGALAGVVFAARGSNGLESLAGALPVFAALTPLAAVTFAARGSNGLESLAGALPVFAALTPLVGAFVGVATTVGAPTGGGVGGVAARNGLT
jgi:hypothetical protein